MRKRLLNLLLLSLLIPTLSWAEDESETLAKLAEDQTKAVVKAESHHELIGALVSLDKKNTNWRLAGSAEDMRAKRKCLLYNKTLKKLNEGFPFKIDSECLEMRPKATESIFESNVLSSSRDYIENDIEVCNCMRLTAGGHLSSSETEVSKNKLTLQHLEANLKEKQQRLQRMNEGMAIQSSLISKDKRTGTELMKLYAVPAHWSTKKSLKESMEKIRKEAIAKLVNPNAKDMEDLNKIINSITPPVDVEEIKTPSSVPPRGSCISMRAYLAFEQLPKEGEFYKDLGEMTGFKKEDWDLESLKSQYDIAYRNSEKATINKQEAQIKSDALKARINFLKKNPLISNIFSAKSGRNENKTKEKLFKLIQSGMRPGVTRKEYQEYQEKLYKLFSNRKVARIARRELNSNIKDEYKDNGVLSKSLPTTQAALENKFQLMTNTSVSNCTLPNEKINMEECSKNFPLYCKLVSSVVDNEKNGKGLLALPSENLDLESQFDFNPDPSKNAGFQKLSREICHQPRTLRGKPGVVMDFNQFKNSYCGDSAKKKPECVSGNNELLVKRFITDYAPMEKEGVDLSVQDAYQLAFASVMIDQPKVNFTRKDMEVVKKSSVTYNVIATKGFPKSQAKLADSQAQPAKVIEKPVTHQASKSTTSATFASDEFPLPAPKGGQKTFSAVPVQSPQEEQYEYSKEMKQIEDDLEETRQELADAKDRKDKAATAELEKRLKSLEELLAKKDEDYKRLMEDKSMAKAEEKEKAASAPATLPVSGGAPSKIASSGDEAKQPASNSEEGNTGRFPGSVPDTNTSSGGSQSGSSSAASSRGGASAKVSSAGSMLNSALLEKYGISVNGSVEAAHLLATGKDETGLKLLVGSYEGQNIPLEVSASQYEKFKRYDLKMLTALYDKKIKTVDGAVVKISVTTKNRGEPLEFYAVREGGKVIFQPVVRKARAEDLRMIMDL